MVCLSEYTINVKKKQQIIKTMKTIIKKISEARQIIASQKIEKQGKNSFANYKYFTPEQVQNIVQTACEKCQILPVFSLLRHETGVKGTLTVYDIETAESIVFEMETAIPEIKATNMAQQLGGCMTYTERYLQMSAFGIKDNSLDFDSNENTPAKTTAPEKTWFNENDLKGKQTVEWANFLKAVETGTEITLEGIKAKYKVNAETEAKIISILKK